MKQERRLEITVGSELADQIKLAAKLDGRSISNFLRQAAVEKVQRVLPDAVNSPVSELVGTTGGAVRELSEKAQAPAPVVTPAQRQPIVKQGKFVMDDEDELPAEEEETEEELNRRMERDAPAGKRWLAEFGRYIDWDD